MERSSKGGGRSGGLACAEVARRLAADGEGAAAEAPELAAHLAGCAPCRAYASQLGLLGGAARDLAGRFAPDRATVRRLEQEILEPRLKPR